MTKQKFRARVFLSGKYWIIDFIDRQYWSTQACDNREVNLMATDYIMCQTGLTPDQFEIEFINPEALDQYNLSTPMYYYYKVQNFFYRQFANGQSQSHI